ncbi:MAG: hypothetical protein SVY53_05315 [Chloroflexota bacterium]|nr:hypothetical protein [Chloroflexota bacterium]
MGGDGHILLRWMNEKFKLVDYEHRLIHKDLTSDGVQWGAGDEGVDASYTTTSVGSLEEAAKFTVDVGFTGTPKWVEVGLTIDLEASADNSAGKWKWTGSVDDSTYTDLFSLVTESDIDTSGTGSIERTRQGFAKLTIFTDTPIYIKLMVQCDTVGETVTAKVKSSSYVRIIQTSDN